VLILHVMTAEAWRSWRPGEPYAPASLSAEGFVHCSGDDVMLDVANRFYASDEGDWVVVTLDPAELGSEVRWEPAAHPDGSPPDTAAGPVLFPHVYGPLEREAVVGVRRLVREGGAFVGYGPMA
jgi:uncharacterized protein (DUF952 family)